MTSTTANPLDDDYRPTRWQDIKWHIGYRLVGRVLRASAERLKMLGERAAGERPSTLEEDHRQSYDWGYKIGLGNGIVAAMTEWDRYNSSQEPHCAGAPAALVFCLAQDHGLDGAAIVGRVAASSRRRRGEEATR